MYRLDEVRRGRIRLFHRGSSGSKDLVLKSSIQPTKKRGEIKISLLVLQDFGESKRKDKGDGKGFKSGLTSTEDLMLLSKED